MIFTRLPDQNLVSKLPISHFCTIKPQHGYSNFGKVICGVNKDHTRNYKISLIHSFEPIAPTTTQLAFTCSNSIIKHQNNVLNSFEQILYIVLVLLLILNKAMPIR